MKKTICLIMFLGLLNLNGQTINGVWQKNSSVIGSTYNENYEFFKDNSFKYSPSGFDGLSRILAIGGNFYVKQDSIYLSVKYIEECNGGTIIRSTITTLNNSWELVDCIYEKKELIEKIIWAVSFKLFIENDQKVILIGNDKYYLVDE